MKTSLPKLLITVMVLLVIPCVFLGCKNIGRSDEISGDYYDWTRTLKPEKPWVRDYNKTVVMKFFLCHRDSLGNVRKVYLNFSDVLDVVKKMDKITLGVPKIVYLVGWQYSGHDSKYPSWDVVNESLKRPEDATALESLKWLIREAKAYNTSISLHINMIDAFMDSPCWNEYCAKDIIAKDAAGNPIKGEVFDGMQSYQISYAREWQLGYAQKRIDRLVEMIPELKDAGSIHIDAFHSMRPSGPGEPISPYLGLTVEDEMAAQRIIFRYWRLKGIDVTCEGGMYWLRKDPFIGLQAMTWHYREDNFVKEDWINKPKKFSTFPTELCAYPPMQAELNIMKDRDALPGLLEEFCLKVVPWYYKRNTDPSVYSTVTITEDEVLCPVLWKEKTMVAFSKQRDFTEMKVRLPSTWVGLKEVQLYDLTLEGLKPVTVIPVVDRKISLNLKKDQPAIIMGIQ